MVKGNDELIHRNAQLLCGSLDDPYICLMRHEPIYISRCYADLFSGKLE